ncbi:2Fe-2S iron-sulfur cluster-binding protein [Streptomyces sp. NPDC001381]|uniref:2Fe-2S iron-sulfur cluster-binding protein n=1 Tax=Streptomyces sp. NPDC001381 TaxID=3364567 RepID=UPI0036B238EF
MTDDQHGEGTPPQSGGRWDPLPQGDYDDGATAFVKLPEGGIDALLAGDTPLAAPGHGYVPPQITAVPPAADGTGTWAAPAGGTEWPAPQLPPETSGGDRFTYDPGSTGQWAFTDNADRAVHPAGPSAPAPGHDVTGQWSIPVAGGDLPDESGEFTTSALVEQWGGTPPATLPGGAPAPWAPGATNGAGRPWAQEAEQSGAAEAAHAGVQETGHPAAPAPTAGRPAPEEPAFGHRPEPGAAHDTAHETAYETSYGMANETAHGVGHTPPHGVDHTPPDGVDHASAHGVDHTPPYGDDHTPPYGVDHTSAHGTGHAPAHAPEGAPAETRPGNLHDPSDHSGHSDSSGHSDRSGPPPGAPDAPEAVGDASEAVRAVEALGDAGDAHEPAEAAQGPAEPPAGHEPDPAQADADDPAAVRAEAETATEHTAQTPEEIPPPPAEEHPLASYVLRVNGSDRPVTDAWIGESLLYVLRERLGLAGAKDGCSQGECGACNVQVDGRLVASCLVPSVTTAGSEIRTVEGLAVDGQPSDVQRALARCGAVQCGFCVPGMAMTLHDLLEGNPAPTELEARQALCGNLCRCSGYRGVLRAVKDVVAEREAQAAAEAETDGDEARIPHQAGPGAGGVHSSAFENPAQPHPHDPVYGQGQDGGQA